MTGRSDAVTLLSRGTRGDKQQLSHSDREKLIQPLLPKSTDHEPKSQAEEQSDRKKNVYERAQASSSFGYTSFSWQRPRLRPLVSTIIYKLLFTSIQLAFSVYINVRQICYAISSQVFSVLNYHHRSPELIQRDIRALNKLPQHLSVIVDLEGEDGNGGRAEALSKLIDDVAEVAAWCTCAGIPMLSVYERTGILKAHMPSLHRGAARVLHSYYPPGAHPCVHIRAPHFPAFSPPQTANSPPASPATKLDLLLLSAADGRETLVDLTKTLTEMSQQGKLGPNDITPELINAEVTENSCGEPDLLILMAPSNYKGRREQRQRTERKCGKRHAGGEERRTEARVQDDVGGGGAGGDVCLRGYPPWQVRLTEMIHVQGCDGVEYQAFLQALHQYADCQMRFGR